MTASTEIPEMQDTKAWLHRLDYTPVLLLVVILTIAASARIIGLGRHSYLLDEIWTVEVATGRGSAQQRIPLNQAIQPPDIFNLRNAPPWWNVWTHLEVTHPPLYWVLLRWWEDIFGDSDRAGRMFSVITSLLAIALFFDVVRLLNGTPTAAWAALLMALASPQVDYGRLTRNYAILMLLTFAMAAAIVRIEKLGFTRRRLVGLFLAVLATLLTHYFCIGVIAGLMIYSAMRFSGRLRMRVLGAFVVAGIVFVVIWGPFMWQQRTLFSTTDEATLYLSRDLPGHFWNTIERVLLVPSTMLFPIPDSMRPIAAGSAILYLLPLIMCRRRPDLLLWGLWLIGSVTVVAGLDLTRHTTHLFYPRYTILAGPPVYVLLPALFAGIGRFNWIRHVIPAAAAAACALAVPDLQITSISDSSEVVRDMSGKVGPDDLLIFEAVDSLLAVQTQYMMIDRCLGPLQCRIVVLTRPPDVKVMDFIMHSSHVYVFSDNANWHRDLPGMHGFEGRIFPGWGLRMRLK